MRLVIMESVNDTKQILLLALVGASFVTLHEMLIEKSSSEN